MARRIRRGHRRSHGAGMSRWVPACLLAASSVVVSFAAVAASEAPKSGSPKPTVIYVCGEPPRGTVMARIEVRSPGTRGHALTVIAASGPTPRPTPGPPPGAPPRPNVHCSTPEYSFGKDADLIELRPGPYRLTAKAERLFPLPSAFTPASVFTVDANVTVRGGRCYAPVMTCDGDATDGAACHLKLKPKSCGRLRSPRRVVLQTILAC